MTVSTILQHPAGHPASRHGGLATAIGRELRRRRIEANLSQAAVGTPFTRAFVCAVERGRVMPSIPALAVFLDHLGTDFDDFFRGVQSHMTVRYSPAHGNGSNASSGGRR